MRHFLSIHNTHSLVPLWRSRFTKTQKSTYLNLDWKGIPPLATLALLGKIFQHYCHVIQYCPQPTVAVLTMNGVYTETHTPANPTRSFHRTFVIAPNNNGGFCIVNDMLFVTNTTKEQVRKILLTSLKWNPTSNVKFLFYLHIYMVVECIPYYNGDYVFSNSKIVKKYNDRCEVFNFSIGGYIFSSSKFDIQKVLIKLLLCVDRSAKNPSPSYGPIHHYYLCVPS